jgi:segregation and condensation protein B
MSDRVAQLRLLEALLFAAGEPLSEAALALRVGAEADLTWLLCELAESYAARGVNLVRMGGGWTFRTAPDLAAQLRVERPVVRKLSRAAVETLAVIAYHQPVTRAEIEEIRGVALGKGTLDALMEAGWVRPKGRRMTPGRPLIWVTTETFLTHFGLDSLGELPAAEELRAAGLLDLTPPVLGEEASAPEGQDGQSSPLPPERPAGPAIRGLPSPPISPNGGEVAEDWQGEPPDDRPPVDRPMLDTDADIPGAYPDPRITPGFSPDGPSRGSPAMGDRSDSPRAGDEEGEGVPPDRK